VDSVLETGLKALSTGVVTYSIAVVDVLWRVVLFHIKAPPSSKAPHELIIFLFFRNIKMNNRRRIIDSDDSDDQVQQQQPKKKSKKKQLKLTPSLVNIKRQIIESLTSRFVGNHILLKASDLYGIKKIPRGEEQYLFQYQIASVNDDCATAEIEYDSKCIVEGDH